MILRIAGCLVLSVILLALSGALGIAESQTKKEKSTQPAIKQANIEGFRSAKFGMNEKQVLRAIAKDFKVYKSKVDRKIHLDQKTTTFTIHLSKLLEVGGPADIVYILGYKTKGLIQVNIDWGKGVRKGAGPEEVANAANLLRTYFIKARYKKEGYSVNSKIDDTRILVFRGRDKKNRMIFLRLTRSKPENNTGRKETSKNVSLVLSYMLNPDNPDIYRATK